MSLSNYVCRKGPVYFAVRKAELARIENERLENERKAREDREMEERAEAERKRLEDLRLERQREVVANAVSRKRGAYKSKFCSDTPLQMAPVEAIKSATAQYFTISVDDLISKRRFGYLSYARQIAYYLCRKHTDNSLTTIGNLFGGRDHATIFYGVNQICALIENKSRPIHADLSAIRAVLGIGETE